MNWFTAGEMAFFWALFIYSFARDRSRYRNCCLLFLALFFTVVFLFFFSEATRKAVLAVGFLLFFISVLLVPVFLIYNGTVMLKREGLSLANLLSLVFGVLIGTGEIATFFSVFSPYFADLESGTGKLLSSLSVVSVILSISVIYLSFSFVIFMMYVLAMQILPVKKDFDYVIIHGAGLIEGSRVSKLLSDRLDKAIEVYRKDPTPPVLIPSGGKGSDEKLSEAEAMEKYLLEKGIPQEKIIKEDRSATTYENLAYSKEIIDAQEGPKYTALVTSNYHVYRALRYAGRVGLKCTGIGSRVAFYYWPSALIREYIAIHAEPKHLLIFILGWAVSILPMLFFYNSVGII